MSICTQRFPSLVERLQSRRLLAGQSFAGAGPVIAEGPTSAVKADFNNDGKVDLATVNGVTGSVSVLLSLGDGSFAAPVMTALASNASPRSLVAADLNGDGKIDLATANVQNGTVSVLIGVTATTFAAPVNYPAGTNPEQIVTADFNGDGKIDLAVANNNAGGTVSVLLGTGSGTFGAASASAAGAYSESLSAADFNGDGKADLVVGNYGSPASVSLLMGNGSATFATPTTIYSPSGGTVPEFVYATDYNSDGKSDVIVSVGNGASSLVLLKGSGAGTFTTSTLADNNSPQAITTGDFNADGKLDLAVADYAGVSIFNGTSSGTFAAAVFYQDGTNDYGITAADFNGDSKLDLALVSNTTFSVSVLLNKGSGTFPQQTSVAVGTDPEDIVSADFNGDNKADLATANNGSVSILQGNNAGGFTVTAATISGDSDAITAADFNGDGKVDLATANYNSSGNVFVLLGNGAGGFATPVNYTAGSYGNTIVSGDFNGDGKVDLAVAGGSFGVNGAVALLLGTGSGTFTAGSSLSVGHQPVKLAVGDFNGDGKLDLAVITYESNTLQILINGGAGTFTPLTAITIGTSPTSLAAADFNGDGKLDLAIGASSYSNSVTIYQGAGNGTFTVGSVVIAGPNPSQLVVADIDGDGKPDLVASNRNDAMTVATGVGNGTFNPAISVATDQDPEGVAVGDFNGDGKPDVAAADSDTNDVTVALNTRLDPSFVSGSAGTLTISGTTATLSEAAGILTITTPAGTERRLATNVTGLVLGSLTTTINSDLGASGSSGNVSLTVNSGATATFSVSQHLSSLTANGAATLMSGGGKFFRMSTLVIGGSGKLDLNDNDLIYDYSGSASQSSYISNLIATGRGSGGTWTGNGITSTAAKNNAAQNTTLGYAEASTILGASGGSFDGEAVDSTTVLVRYTIIGDANLDRAVNINDLGLLATHYGSTAGTFAMGDFNFDGKVNIADLGLLATNYGKTLVL